MTREQVGAWIANYEKAWRAAGIGLLNDLFTEEATYQMSPYEEPVTGLPAIAELWEGERQGPDEVFTMTSRIVAVEDDTAVVRVDVSYGEPAPREYRDLWLMRFAEDGRCSAFEEWPFWPGQTWRGPGPG